MDTPSPHPTDAELGLLEILWDRGPLTVREVHECLCGAGQGKEVGYTTVLKLLQIMTEKGLVARDESARSHVYHALISRDGVQQNVLSRVIAKVFRGSTRHLVLGALSGQPTDPADLRALKREIEAMLAQQGSAAEEGEP